mgnify:FL=1
MTQATYPPGMLSLSYHVIYDDTVRDKFRSDWVAVATQFALNPAAEGAIATATQRGVYSQDDANAICAFMDADLQRCVDAPPSRGDGSSELPPPGMLSAVYHIFDARDGIPLSSFDLNEEEENAIVQKDLTKIRQLLYADFNRHYDAIYTLAW